MTRLPTFQPSARTARPNLRSRAAGVLAAAGVAAIASAASSQVPVSRPAEKMRVLPAETLQAFRPLVASSPDGPNIIPLEGDPYAGPSITLFRYANGYTGSRRLHTHSHAYRSILIEGEMKHWGADGSEDTATTLRPGSYWVQPGGQPHADHCLTDRCLAMVLFEAEIDAQFPDGHD